jgi:predicted dienelactone hydrolase
MASSSIRKMLPSMRQDYIRRHQASRRITNVTLVLVLSLAAGYMIIRQPEKAFSIPGAPRQPAGVSESARAISRPEANSAAVYARQAGPYTVGEVADLVLHDGKRRKDLHVRIFYPKQLGKYPVIVFSHGAGGSQTCCDALTRHWASYGYVTLQPTHDDSVEQRRGAGEEDVRFTQAVGDALKTPALWESRPRDISFVIDSLATLEGRIPQAAGRLDLERIGVGGHSMGSYTSEAIAGATVDLPGRPGTSFADARVKAVLCLSPQGPGQLGLSERSFDAISVPYLGITGTLDTLGPMATPAWHKIPFDRSPPGEKYEVLIRGANHMSFITASTLAPSRAAQADSILDYTNAASLAFWDAYLKNNSAARRYLQADGLETASQGAAKVERR